MRGRKPNPAGLEVVKGANAKDPKRRKREAVAAEVEVEGLGKPPAYLKLSKEAKAVWKTDAPHFAIDLDRRAFGRYCQLVADAARFHADCEKEGWTVKGTRFTNPKARLYQDARDAAERLASSFGLKPAERTRIPVKPKKKASPADEFRKGRGT